jgi:hypothetical protein
MERNIVAQGEPDPGEPTVGLLGAGQKLHRTARERLIPPQALAMVDDVVALV